MEQQKPGGSAPSTPRKLDTMSQEDLVKYSKKQMMLLQKLKAKCDGLQKELKTQADYNETKQKCIQFEKIIDENSKEREEIIQSRNQLQKEKNSIGEEFDCYKMKQETLLITLQCLQEDHNKVSDENKKLKQEMEDFKARDQQDIMTQTEDKSRQLVALKEHIKSMKLSHEKLEESNATLMKENKEAKAEISAAKISLEMFKSKASGSDDTLKSANEKIVKFEAELKKFQSENKALEKELTQLRDTEIKFQSMCDDLETARKEKLSSDNGLKEVELRLEAKVLELEALENRSLEDQKFWESKFSEIENAKKSDAEKMTANLERANQEISNLEAQIDLKEISLNEELNALKEKLAQFEVENIELTKKNDVFLSNASEDNQNLEEERMKLDEINAELKRKDAEINAFQIKLDDKTKEYDSVVLQFEQQQNEMTSMKNLLEEQGRNLTQDNESKLQENNELKVRLASLENEIKKLKKAENEHLELTEHYEVIKKEKIENQNIIDEITIQLNSKLMEIEDIKKQQCEISEKYEAQILENQTLKSSADNELADLNKQLVFAKQEISDLKNKFSAEDSNEIALLEDKNAQLEKEHLKLAEINQQNENKLNENCQLLDDEKRRNMEIVAKLEQKESEFSILENNLSANNKEFENLVENCQEIESQLSSTQQQLGEKEKYIQEKECSAANELAQLRDVVQEKSDISNEQQETIQTLNVEIERFSQIIAENAENSTQLSVVNEKLVEEISEAATLTQILKSEVSALRSSEKELKDLMEEKELRNQSLINELRTQTESNQSTEETRQNEESKRLQASLEVLASDKLKLEEELSIVEQKCQGLEQNLEEIHQKDEAIAELKRKHEEITAENTSFKQKIEALGIQIDDLNEMLAVFSAVEDKYKNAESEVKALKSELLDKTATFEDISSKLIEAVELGKKLKQESENYRKEIENQRAESSQTIDSNESEIQNLKEQISELTNTASELKSFLQNSECEKKDLCSKIEAFQIEMDEISIQQREDADLKTEVDSLRAKECELNLKLSQINKEVDDLKSENSSLKELVESNEASQLQQVDEKTTKDQEIVKLTESRSVLQNELSEVRLKSENLAAELSSFTTENSKLKEELSSCEQHFNDEVKQVQFDLQSQLDLNAQLSEKFTILEQQECNNKEVIANLKSEFFKKQGDLETINEELSLKLETMEKQWVEHERAYTAEHVEGSSDNKQIDQLQKSIKEKELYTTKLKMVAVKAKKELDSTKSQLQSQAEENNKLLGKIKAVESQLMGSQTQASNVQMMQIECDKLQDQLDQMTEEKSALNKNIEELFNQLSTTQTEKADLKSKLDLVESDLEKSAADNVETEKKLTLSKSNYLVLDNEKEGIVKQKSQLLKEIDALKNQVSNLVKNLDEKEKKYEASQQSLSNATKNLKQNDLLSLEITEYEKTINDLHVSVSELENLKQEEEKKSEELEKKVAELQNERSDLEQLRQEAELRVTRTKEMLDGTRDDIEKLSSNELKLNNELEDARQQIETLQQESERLKLDLSQKVSECRMAEEQINQLKNSHDLNLDILERKLKGTQADLMSYKNEKERLSLDYESYKVRVHSVLKQQKSRETKNQTPELNAELIGFRQKVDLLQLKHLETQNALTSRDGELDLLQGDYDRLLRQQQQSSESATEREGRWKSRVKSLQQELVQLRKQHSELQKKMTDLNETCVSLDVVTTLKQEHEAALESLNGQLAKRDNEIFKLKSELSEERKVSVTSTPKKLSVSIPPPARNNDHYLTSSITGLDFRGVDREEGEGEENPDQPPPLSFEEILQSPTEIKSVKLLSETQSMTSEVNLKYIEAKYEAQSKQLEHLTEVARENEATSARLMDQNKVLKNEIRRLEKNQERESSVSNMEYLKNVIYKFITLPPCDERRHLLPVIDTMLKFNDAERKSLQHLAMGDDGSADQDIEGWGSYLQRWSGM